MQELASINKGTSESTQVKNDKRIVSIDILKGIVMVLMSLDHVRWFYHVDARAFNPLDLSQTHTFLFLTRWVTHYCAPVFIFLAGTSVFFMRQRKSKQEVSHFLWTRGLWLIVLELTLFRFFWNPNFFRPSFAPSRSRLDRSFGLGVPFYAFSLSGIRHAVARRTEPVIAIHLGHCIRDPGRRGIGARISAGGEVAAPVSD